MRLLTPTFSLALFLLLFIPFLLFLRLVKWLRKGLARF